MDEKQKFIRRHLAPLIKTLRPGVTAVRYTADKSATDGAVFNEKVTVVFGSGYKREIDVSRSALSVITMTVLKEVL